MLTYIVMGGGVPIPYLYPQNYECESESASIYITGMISMSNMIIGSLV